MQPTNLAEVIQHIAKEQQAKVAHQIAEAQLRLITVAYDRAASYTTVIIFGGYAGFFAIWQLSKDYLSKGQALWSALLIMISLLSFILFEVIKMVMVSRSIFKKVAVLNTRSEVRNDPQQLLKALNELAQTQQASLGDFHKFWAITVVIALAFALSGAAVLGYAFITGLAR